MSEKEFFYRYNEIRYSLGVDQWDDPLPGYNLAITLDKYEVSHHTPKGTWIYIYHYGLYPLTDEDRPKKFILASARKKFACPTKEEAWKSFRERKKAQIRILRSQLEQAEAALHMAETYTPENIQDKRYLIR